ncbi:MAG: ABC transporter permease subunit [Thermoplasmata archaeon]|nr:ABC transporter permease subunit [Thermoplasmata archaeon]MCI4359170.1 ABC transporter permease subunit [Thermoplasmata archaeon]
MAGDRQSVRRVGPFDRDLLGVLPVLGFVAAVTLLPVALLFATGTLDVGGMAGVGRILEDPVNVRAIENSLTEGGASALAAVAVGYPSGVFLGRTRVPGRPLLLSTLLVPFLLPTVAVAFGVVEIFGPGGFVSAAVPALGVLGSGFGGIVLANVVFNAPVVVLLTVVGVESAPTDLEETVRSLGGGPVEAFRTVWGRPSLLGALAGGLITFLFSALAFAGPILIGGAPWYTLEARVYFLAQTLAEGPQAAVLAMLTVALLAPATILYVWVASRLRSGASLPRAGPPRFDRRSPAAWVLGSWTGFSVAAVGALLALVVYRGLAPSPQGGFAQSFAELFTQRVSLLLGLSTTSAVANTVAFAALSSLSALLLALTAAHYLSRRPRAQRAVAAVAFAPLLISPIVLSFALAEFVRPALGGESAAPLLIILSQATLALPFALQAIGLTLSRTSPAPGEAARALGASAWQAYLDVELPSIRSGLRAAALFAFALGLGEFTSTNFLANVPSTTLSVELYHLQSVRLAGPADAVAALLVLVSLAVFGAVALWGEGRTDVL